MAQLPIGIFVNLTREQLTALQTKAYELMLEGKTIMGYGDGSTNAQKQFTMPISDMMAEINYALARLDKRPRALYFNYNQNFDK